MVTREKELGYSNQIREGIPPAANLVGSIAKDGAFRTVVRSGLPQNSRPLFRPDNDCRRPGMVMTEKGQVTFVTDGTLGPAELNQYPLIKATETSTQGRQAFREIVAVEETNGILRMVDPQTNQAELFTPVDAQEGIGLWALRLKFALDCQQQILSVGLGSLTGRGETAVTNALYGTGLGRWLRKGRRFEVDGVDRRDSHSSISLQARDGSMRVRLAAFGGQIALTTTPPQRGERPDRLRRQDMTVLVDRGEQLAREVILVFAACRKDGQDLEAQVEELISPQGFDRVQERTASWWRKWLKDKPSLSVQTDQKPEPAWINSFTHAVVAMKKLIFPQGENLIGANAGRKWEWGFGRDMLEALEGMLAGGMRDEARGLLRTLLVYRKGEPIQAEDILGKLSSQSRLIGSVQECLTQWGLIAPRGKVAHHITIKERGGVHLDLTSADASSKWILGTKAYLDWTGDTEFVSAVLPQLKETLFAMGRMIGRDARVKSAPTIICDQFPFPKIGQFWIDVSTDAWGSYPPTMFEYAQAFRAGGELLQRFDALDGAKAIPDPSRAGEVSAFWCHQQAGRLNQALDSLRNENGRLPSTVFLNRLPIHETTTDSVITELQTRRLPPEEILEQVEQLVVSGVGAMVSSGEGKPNWALWLSQGLTRIGRKQVPYHDFNADGHTTSWPFQTVNLGSALVEASQRVDGKTRQRMRQVAWNLWQWTAGLENDLALTAWPEVVGVRRGQKTTSSCHEVRVQLPESPDQLWSAAAVPKGLTKIVLGLQPKAVEREIELDPYLPPDTDELSVGGLPIGDGRLMITVCHGRVEVGLDEEALGPFKVKVGEEEASVSPGRRLVFRSKT